MACRKSGLRRQFDNFPSPWPDQSIPPRFARLSPGKTVGRNPAALGKDRHAHVPQKLDFTDDTLAPTIAPASA